MLELVFFGRRTGGAQPSGERGDGHLTQLQLPALGQSSRRNRSCSSEKSMSPLTAIAVVSQDGRTALAATPRMGRYNVVTESWPLISPSS
ncbi:MAG: hypothetical protein ACXW08_04770 [Solirubrobacteraceae bacterium]